jgi:N6-adenosine-specific RNA methylase IME4
MTAPSNHRHSSARYRTIVADPPWEMARGSDYSWREGKASGERQQLDYGTMTTDEIAGLPVGSWADKDAHLFVWTTHRHLEATFAIVRAWGFGYVCTLTWCKQPHGWGPGGAFQSTTEFVLYARRGKSGVEGQIDRQWWDRTPVRLRDPEDEVCCHCGRMTLSGIYVRVDPATVSNPTKLKDG